MPDGAPIVLLKGSDPVLIGDAATAQLREMLGGRSHDEVVDVFDADLDEGLADAVMAAGAVSMFGERIIVIRNAARLDSKAVDPLVRYLGDPSPETRLLLVWEKPQGANQRANPVPKALLNAVAEAGGVVHQTDVGTRSADRAAWVDEQIAASGVRIDAAAKQFLTARLGEDLSRLGGVLRVLAAAFPDRSRLGPDDIEPYVGEPGSIPPWDLTDAIDRGDVTAAVASAARMMNGGSRHPLQIMASLSTHITRMVRLDGACVVGEKDAAALLGMKGSTFPAKKALAQANRMGGERLARAVRLLAAADADLRGATGLGNEVVVEVLVGRLAQLNRRG
ncbi:MAG: DNA polymerase III subunit delta [Microthrixaceae bacterium]